MSIIYNKALAGNGVLYCKIPKFQIEFHNIIQIYMVVVYFCGVEKNVDKSEVLCQSSCLSKKIAIKSEIW